MPRIRSVHPGICTSESLADVSAELERTFVRLWTHCDDEGRCLDRPKLLKAALYPEHDNITPESLDGELTLLAHKGFIARYEVEGVRYIAVLSWDKYQHPQRPRKSQYPPPPVHVAEDARTDTEHLPDVHVPGEGVGEGEGDRSTGDGEGDGVSSLAETPTAIVPSNGRSLSKAETIADSHLEHLKPLLARGGSFDLLAEFRKAWEAAWAEAADAGVAPNVTGIRLLAKFIGTITGEKPDWGRAGRLVNRFGKVSLLGIDKALKVEADDPYTYAWTVCDNKVKELPV